MTHLRQRMIEDMQLRGLSEKTQENYVRAVRQLAEHYGKSPDRIDEEELRHYFLYLKNDKQVAAGTFSVALHGDLPPRTWTHERVKIAYNTFLGGKKETAKSNLHPRIQA